MNVFADSQVRGVTPSIVGGTGTSAKIFVSLLGPGFGNGGNTLGTAAGTSKPSVPSPSASAPAAIVAIPGNNGTYEGQQIEVRASGVVFVHGTSPTLNFVLQSGTSLTATSNTTIATLASAQSLTTNASYPFYFRAVLQGDSQSGIVQVGNATFVCNGTSGSLTLTDLTGVNFFANGNALSLVFGVTFGVSDSTNVGQLMQFQAGT